jgi:hypothetical protein
MKAKNRFKVPSSAVSLPSLTLDETGEEESGQTTGGPAGPGSERSAVLEKSVSSASIVRTKDKVARLGKIFLTWLV